MPAGRRPAGPADAAGRQQPVTRGAVTVTRLMTIDRSDFLRILRRNLGPGESLVFDPGAQSHFLHLPAGRVAVRLQAMPARELGSLRLPQQSVSLCFEDMSQEDQERFLARLARACQRAGG